MTENTTLSVTESQAIDRYCDTRGVQFISLSHYVCRFKNKRGDVFIEPISKVLQLFVLENMDGFASASSGGSGRV